MKSLYPNRMLVLASVGLALIVGITSVSIGDTPAPETQPAPAKKPPSTRPAQARGPSSRPSASPAGERTVIAAPPGFKSLFDGKSLGEWEQQLNGKPGDNSLWIVREGVIASTPVGRGTLFTKEDYTKFRFVFSMRHVGASGGGDHQPCVLIFCTRPAPGAKPLDALGGIQFQVPNGGHWDYRPGFNKGGEGFTKVTPAKFDNKQWFRVEILADATTGTARMAVAQPIGSKAVEVLSYNVPAAGKTGPIALQIHNGGLYDEYADLAIESDPKDNDLITTK